jgi:hypothetical protein
MTGSEFEAGLKEQVDQVFKSHPEFYDHRKEFKWLTSSLGDPFSGVWFVAEYPSLRMNKRAKDPGGGPPTVEAQWFASKGDELFRKALVHAQFKTLPWDIAGGWKCYITNLIKETDYTQNWTAQRKRVAAEAWFPVMRWQLEHGNPWIVIVMGRDVEKFLIFLAKQEGVPLPHLEYIPSYVYIASRPDQKRRPAMDPARISEYNKRFVQIAQRYQNTIAHGNSEPLSGN